MRMAMPRSSGQVARSGFTGGGLSVHREREHEHAARLPETGHGELARADEPPGRGQRLELLFGPAALHGRSEEHTSELQSQSNLVCRLLLEKKKKLRSIGRSCALCYG